MSEKGQNGTENNSVQKPKKKKRFMALKLILLSILLIILFSGAIAGGITIAMIKSAPDLDMSVVINTDQPSIILDDAGDEMDKIITEKERKIITIDKMSQDLKNAIVSIEDERFYEHDGIDPKRIIGAFYQDILGVINKDGTLQGASTITQQLLKNTLLDPGDTFSEKVQRKFQEIYLAYQLDQQLDKDEILATYLNTIYCGGKAIGVEAASFQYFHKTALELDTLESAFIAGITQSPSVYYPYSLSAKKKMYPIASDTESEPQYITRTKTVLAAMKKTGAISETQYSELLEELNNSNLTRNLYRLYNEGFITEEYYTKAVTESDFNPDLVDENLVNLYLMDYKSDPENPESSINIRNIYDSNVSKLYKKESVVILSKDTSRFLIEAGTILQEDVDKLISEDTLVDYLENQLLSNIVMTEDLPTLYSKNILTEENYNLALSELKLKNDDTAQNITKIFQNTDKQYMNKNEFIEYLKSKLDSISTDTIFTADASRMTLSMLKIKYDEECILADIYEDGFLTNEEYNYMVLGIDIESSLGNKIITSSSTFEEVFNYEWYSRPLVDQVEKDLMEQYNLTKDEADNMLVNGNLKIYSSMNRDLQEKTKEILNDPKYYPVDTYVDKDGNMQPQASATLVDYHTGEVKAMVGGRFDYGPDPYNRAYDAQVPTGSSIKPLTVYAPAIDTKMFTAGTVIEDSPLTVSVTSKYGKGNDTSWPQNDNRKYKGYVTLRNALKYSINVVAAKIVDQVGISTAFEYSKKFGLTLDPSDEALAPLALGQQTWGSNTYEMANAFGTFGNEGKYTEPRLYTKVVNSEGKVLLETKVVTEEVISPQTAYIMYDLLKGPTQSGGTASGIWSTYKQKVAIRGKTGTSTNNKNLWFCGLTPYYSGAVWIDNPDEKKIYSSHSAKLWGAIMNYANEGLENITLERPDGVVYAKIDGVSGLLPSELSYQDPRGSLVYSEMFIAGTVPNKEDDIHVEAEVNSENNLLATEFTPPELLVKKVFITRDYEPTVTLGDQEYVLPTELDDTPPPEPEPEPGEGEPGEDQTGDEQPPTEGTSETPANPAPEPETPNGDTTQGNQQQNGQN
ncbi:transglycosylase domain-containing protein [Clostridium sp. DL1XJH146]